MFCRAADLTRVGGFDARLPILEEADLCIRLHMAGPAGLPGRGRVVQLPQVNVTSGRRLECWGNAWGTGELAALVAAGHERAASPTARAPRPPTPTHSRARDHRSQLADRGKPRAVAPAVQGAIHRLISMTKAGDRSE